MSVAPICVVDLISSTVQSTRIDGTYESIVQAINSHLTANSSKLSTDGGKVYKMLHVPHLLDMELCERIEQDFRKAGWMGVKFEHAMPAGRRKGHYFLHSPTSTDSQGHSYLFSAGILN